MKKRQKPIAGSNAAEAPLRMSIVKVEAKEEPSERMDLCAYSTCEDLRGRTCQVLTCSYLIFQWMKCSMWSGSSEKDHLQTDKFFKGVSIKVTAIAPFFPAAFQTPPTSAGEPHRWTRHGGKA
ncbi:hypothetical protein NE237_028125 [Protea cynaroides]|uniref:Uncharacterized protein n=1 Tax=Protea cynaroides TaxID=273540 RepID=A0A9Q0GRE7_9MAGN|nr:hypothetical protein NE237_028125 [Protea cynaroides]